MLNVCIKKLRGVKMSYPKLIINLDKIRENAIKMMETSWKKGIEVTGVTKVTCGNETIAKTLVESGINILGDSRIENLKKMNNLHCKKMLLRIPMPSQAEEVVKYSDIILVSELFTINKLSKEAIIQNKTVDLVLMIDLGDLREGLFYEDEIFHVVKEILKLKNIKLTGIGTNLNCYGALIPTKEILKKLIVIKNNLENTFNINLKMISGGNSGSLKLLQEDQLPKGINQLRLGSSIILGIGADHLPVMGMNTDTIILKAEIVELRKKPSVPIGEQGLDAFGNKPVFLDRGIRSKAVCALGRQDVSPENISPFDDKITILGSSSDHLILDVTDSSSNLNVGDTIKFKISYGGCLSLMTSPYVSKEFITMENK
jgi:predicted amino acid racemase